MKLKQLVSLLISMVMLSGMMPGNIFDVSAESAGESSAVSSDAVVLSETIDQTTSEPTFVVTPTPTLVFDTTAASEQGATAAFEPEATVTLESKATSTPEPDETVTPEPEANTTLESGAPTTFEPEATATPEPKAIVTLETEVTTTLDPDVTTTLEPDASATLVPEITATSEPEGIAKTEPEAKQIPEPEVIFTYEPEATAKLEPEVTATSEPEATSAPEPEATASTEPEVIVMLESEATAAPEPTLETNVEQTEDSKLALSPEPIDEAVPVPTATLITEASPTPREASASIFSLMGDIETKEVDVSFASLDGIATLTEVEPLAITVTLDKETVAIGEAVTATWTVTGGEAPYTISDYSWIVNSAGSSILNKTSVTQITDNEFTSNFTPTIGESVYISLWYRDSAGRLKNRISPTIPVTGGNVIEPLDISVTLDKETVAIGETVTATWTITGGELPYSSVTCSWTVWEGDTGYGMTGSCEGNTSTYTPVYGDSLSIDVSVTDASGRRKVV